MSQTNEDRLLYALKSRGPQAAAALAATVAITPMGAHKLLARLETQGLVEAQDDQRGEAGRPRKLWSLTAAGHGRFPDRHGDLTVQLIQQARAVFGEAGLDQLIVARERDSELHYRAAPRHIVPPSSMIQRADSMPSAPPISAIKVLDRQNTVVSRPMTRPWP